MHGSLPLARLVNGFLQTSPSRIPHLTFHILRRQASSPASWDIKFRPRTPLRLSRASSTAVRYSPFIHSNPGDAADENNGQPLPDAEADEVPAADAAHGPRKMINMLELLEENHPDRILLGLVTPEIGDDFIKYGNDELFARAICALDPDHFILPYRNLHHHLKPSLETQPKYRYVLSYEERIASFMNILDSLATKRQEFGHSLTLDIYRHLLRCAAVAGAGSFAKILFRESMLEYDIEPDLDCYNYFMEAISWNDAYGRYERYHLRVIRYNLLHRSRETRPLGFSGHGVATSSDPTSAQSIRLQVLTTFNELVGQGLNGNEATFCNLMVAMGREGDIGSVKSVLKSVWNIDLEALNNYDEEELQSPTFYEDDSPLRPSARLLFTVVHVFGTNNEVATGGMLLDYISRHYNLEIPEHIWTHLLEWTFLLSIQHRNYRITRGLGEGRIARRAVDSVYHVFHTEPYNVKPKIVDLLFLVKAHFYAKNYESVIADLRQCMELLQEERTELSTLYDRVRGSIRSAKYNGLFSDGLPSAKFLDLRRKFILTSLKLDAHLQLISIAVRNTFKRKYWWITDRPAKFDWLEWPHREIPNLIEEWTEWLPNTVPYYTPTGHVLLMTKDYRHAAISSANSAQTTNLGATRALLDTNSPVRLQHAVHFISRHRWRPRLLQAFRTEVENDASGRLSDWVLQYETAARQERLQDTQVANNIVRAASEDRFHPEWKPWKGTLKAKKPEKETPGWWEAGLDEHESNEEYKPQRGTEEQEWL